MKVNLLMQAWTLEHSAEGNKQKSLITIGILIIINSKISSLYLKAYDGQHILDDIEEDNQ